MLMTGSSVRSRITDRAVSQPLPLRSAGHLVAEWSLYAALAVVAHLVPWFVAVPCWVVMAWCMLGNGAVAHETVHRHLFRSRRANRVVGAVAAAPVGLVWSVYRQYHLGHHKYTVTDDDPEGAVYRFTSRWVYLAIPVGGLLFVIQMVWWGVRIAVGRPPVWVQSRHSRVEAGVDTVLVVGFFAAMAVLGARDLDLLVDVWLAPWLITLMVLFPMALVPEHYGAPVDDADDALLNSRTIVSNRFVTWLYWANNYHTTHHLAPSLVPQHIPAVTRSVVLDAVPERWVSSGYLRFHLDVFLRPERFDGPNAR